MYLYLVTNKLIIIFEYFPVDRLAINDYDYDNVKRLSHMAYIVMMSCTLLADTPTCITTTSTYSS